MHETHRYNHRLVLGYEESTEGEELYIFDCCTVHFDNTEILITNKCTPLLHI